MSDAPSEESSPAPSIDPPKPRRSPLGALWAVSIVVVAIAVAGTAPFWASALDAMLPWGARQPQPANDSALEARVGAAEAARRDAEDRLAKLETEMQKKEAQTAPPAPAAAAPADAAALQAIGQRLDALESRIANLPAPDTGPLAASVQQMSARLDALDDRIGKLAAASAAQASGTDQDRALLGAVALLRAAVAGSGPFANELQAVEAFAPGDAAVAAAVKPLEAAAPHGIPSAALLALSFEDDVAPAILHAGSAPPPQGGDLGDRVLSRIEGLVTIRRVSTNGGTGGDPVAGTVRAARGALDKGDLAAAIASLQGLSGAPAAAAQDFVAALHARIDAESAVSGLGAHVLAKLAADAAPPQAPQPQETH
jgi:hypothetical protein